MFCFCSKINCEVVEWDIFRHDYVNNKKCLSLNRNSRGFDDHGIFKTVFISFRRWALFKKVGKFSKRKNKIKYIDYLGFFK